MPTQMQLSQKQKTFSKFFDAFQKSRLNFERFEKKDDTHNFCISEITDSEKMVREMFKKSRFKGRIKKQHGKGAIILLTFASQHFHYIY